MTRRLLAVVLAVTALSVATLFVPAALAIREAQRRGDLLELQREAEIIAARVPPTGPIDEAVLEPIVGSDHRLGLYDHDATLLGGVGPDPGDQLVRRGLAGNFAEGQVGNNLVAVVPLRLQDEDSSLVVRIEAPRSYSERRFLRSLAELAAVAVAILALAAALAMGLARRLNRPIEDLGQWAESTAEAAGRVRTIDPPPPTGIHELDALRDSLIAGRTQVSEMVDRERAFSSHVSHQLRTPVAAMRVAVEAELASPRDDPTEALTEQLDQIDRLESTITSLLALARGTAHVVDCRLDELVAEAIAPWRDVAARAARDLRLDTEPVSVRTEPATVGHVVDVLVDNALRHGQGAITVRVFRTRTAAIVEVADQGQPPHDRDPFAEVVADTSHGIGLRLARMLAETATAGLTLADAPCTTFRFTLPRAEDGSLT